MIIINILVEMNGTRLRIRILLSSGKKQKLLYKQKFFYNTIANKLPEPLLTNFVKVCCNLYLAFSGINDNLA